MKLASLLQAGAFALASLSVPAVHAQAAAAAVPASTVDSRLDAFQVIRDASGKESFAPAGQVKPGDLIEYRLTYDNTGRQPVSQLAVNGPVPKGTAFVVGSAQTQTRSELRFSVDDGKTWAAAPLKRSVRGADGKGIEQTVSPEEYTNVEWLARESLQPGVSQNYRYRVRVVSAATAASQ